MRDATPGWRAVNGDGMVPLSGARLFVGAHRPPNVLWALYLTYAVLSRWWRGGEKGSIGIDGGAGAVEKALAALAAQLGGGGGGLVTESENARRLVDRLNPKGRRSGAHVVGSRIRRLNPSRVCGRA